ncbi:MAG: glycoside hydrolase family 13 protein, partial [Clostridia bacterium]|nr:glycoside hydrolase family 13 protein [Clostridia bacterium]
MIYFHDPLIPGDRLPAGAVTTGDSVRLRLRIAQRDGAAMPEAELRVVRRFRTETEEYTLAPAEVCADCLYFELDDNTLAASGVYFYEFSVNDGDDIRVIPGDRITVTEKGLGVPDWFADTVIYQIFPDRFALGEDAGARFKPGSFIYASMSDRPVYIKDSSGEIIRWEFFGGNLEGIRKELDYIRSLGAGTIYLNPIFESASNHRYDTGDYEHVDGVLGGDAAFDRLIGSLEEHGMRLILDGVFSHTGRHSRYFQAALRGEAPYRDWYSFRPDGTYECWWDVLDLPCVNELEPAYLDYTVRDNHSIVRSWLRRGASGWRLDVADELPDVYLEELRQAAAETKPDAVVFGEVWEDGTDKVSYDVHRSYFTAPELHSQTNYLFRARLEAFFAGNMSAPELARAFALDAIHYPAANYYALVNMTGSHDVKRLYTVLLETAGGNASAAQGLMCAYSLIQFCFPGVPLIYYGDEILMEGGTDPDNRRFFDRAALNDPADPAPAAMHDWFASLATLRASDPVLRTGNIELRSV